MVLTFVNFMKIKIDLIRFNVGEHQTDRREMKYSMNKLILLPNSVLEIHYNDIPIHFSNNVEKKIFLAENWRFHFHCEYENFQKHFDDSTSILITLFSL